MGPRDSKPDLRRCVLLACVLCTLLGAWVGCGSTPQERYKVLSFFFDGVPDPSASTRPAGKEGIARGTAAPLAILSHHPPFVEQKCSACHNNLNVLIDSSAMDASRCIACHKTIPRQYPVMHGPVDAGACLWCHSPHESPYPNLLREAPPKLCLQCHEPNQLPSQPIEHKLARESCLDCHTAHGGPKHGLLRADLPATRPASGEVR